MKLLFNGYKVAVWDDEKVLKMDSDDCNMVNVLHATELDT